MGTNEKSRGAARAKHPRAARMRGLVDFQRAYREGSRAKGSILTVVARANGLDRSRLGLSVGRAIWKSAVRRNRIRRIFREAFRLEQTRLPLGFDFVLIPAAPKLEPELAPTREELVRLARKAAARAEERRAHAIADARRASDAAPDSAAPNSAAPGPAPVAPAPAPVDPRRESAP
ncbi:MAG: ribonuclease P protein component [Planctomycetes bacterium]|nr:ribonuclease P protein component [Planctomycetota bacterium]